MPQFYQEQSIVEEEDEEVPLARVQRAFETDHIVIDDEREQLKSQPLQVQKQAQFSMMQNKTESVKTDRSWKETGCNPKTITNRSFWSGSRIDEAKSYNSDINVVVRDPNDQFQPIHLRKVSFLLKNRQNIEKARPLYQSVQRQVKSSTNIIQTFESSKKLVPTPKPLELQLSDFQEPAIKTHPSRQPSKFQKQETIQSVSLTTTNNNSTSLPIPSQTQT